MGFQPPDPVRRPPHRPWRDGPPRFTVGLTPIDAAHWLRPDTETHVLTEKQARLNQPETCYRAAPEAFEAETEAAWAVAGAAGAPAPGTDAPLADAARAVSDDLVVMIPGGGEWRCGALVLTAPTFFSIDHAFGRGLDALHGPVPDGAKLARRIGRVFEHLQPGQPLERFNWTLQAGAERFLPDAAPMRALADRTDAADAADMLHVRVERQTVMKLERTGAVLFTIRICLDPVRALGGPDLDAIAAAWRDVSPEGRAYKGWDRIDRLARAWFGG